jgi:hypothetical protein
MRTKYTKFCILCGREFEALTPWAKYCSILCKRRLCIDVKGRKLDQGRFCRQCGKKFFPSYVTGANQQHCSPDCSKKSARESRSKFYQRNPDKSGKYYQKSRNKIGPDGNLKRFRRRFPNVPMICKSCGEVRVLDICHKPKFKRNGSWRSVKNTTPDKVWILCPTCHALLDRMHYDPAELGLKGGDDNA